MFKGKLRWVIVCLVALATVINYIDRQAITVLWPLAMGPEWFPDKNEDQLKESWVGSQRPLFWPMHLVRPSSVRYLIGSERA